MQDIQTRPVQDLRDHYEEYQHIIYIEEKLQEAEEEAASPDAVWEDYKDVFKRLRKQYQNE